jgi:uncharacterized membrane protein
MEDCYAVSLKNGGEESVRINGAAAIPLTIQNNGEQPGTYTLSISGPEYVYVEPKSIQLGFGEEQQVYMYISPPFGTEAGSFVAKVSVFSEHAQNTLDIPVTLLPSVGNGIIEPQGGTGNITMNQTGGSISLNVSAGGEENQTQPTVSLTGQLSAFQRTAIVGVITVVIIIILLVRFAFLFRK